MKALSKILLILIFLPLSFITKPSRAEEKNQLSVGSRYMHMQNSNLNIPQLELRYAYDLTPQVSLGLGVGYGLLIFNGDLFGRLYLGEANLSEHRHRFYTETSLNYHYAFAMVSVMQAFLLSQKLGYEYRYKNFFTQVAIGGGGLLYGHNSWQGGRPVGFTPILPDAQVSVGVNF